MPRQMKDSGVEWIGIIPKSWDCPELKHFVHVNNGKEIGLEVSKDDVVAYPVYGSGGIFKYTDQYMYDGTCVMFGRKGTLGKPIFVTDKFWVVDTMYYLTHTDDLDAKFNYYQLVAFDWESHTTQTALPSVVASEIVSCKFPMPKKSEQITIAGYLDKQCEIIDSVLEQTRASIEEYKKLKQAVITQAVTKGIRCDRPMKDSGSVWFASIPENWDMRKIKYVFSIKKDIAGKEGYTILSITQRGIIPKDISKNEGQLAANYSNYQLVNPGDFAMNHMDLLTGWVDISRYLGVTSPDYRVFFLNDVEQNCDRYFLYMMQMCYSNRIFYGLGQGVSGLGRWRLQSDKFLNFEIAVPPIEEQIAIADYLDDKCAAIDTLIEKKQKAVGELENYKKSLIYEYITGKKEVPQS